MKGLITYSAIPLLCSQYKAISAHNTKAASTHSTKAISIHNTKTASAHSTKAASVPVHSTKAASFVSKHGIRPDSPPTRRTRSTWAPTP